MPNRMPMSGEQNFAVPLQQNLISALDVALPCKGIFLVIAKVCFCPHPPPIRNSWTGHCIPPLILIKNKKTEENNEFFNNILAASHLHQTKTLMEGRNKNI